MAKDETYAQRDNPSCEACNGTVSVHTPDRSAMVSKTDFAKPRFSNLFLFNAEQQPNWRLRLFFHGRKTVTETIVLNIRANGCERYHIYHGRDVNGDPSLLLAHVDIETPSPLLPDPRFYFGRILGTVTRPSSPMSELQHEIRTDRFLLFGGNTPLADGFVIPYPLVHMVTSFDIFE